MCLFNSKCCSQEEMTIVNCATTALRPQSGIDAARASSDSNTDTQVNVTFDDLVTEGTLLAPVVNTIYKPTSSQNAGIAQFLSRPVLIKTVNMSLGVTIDTKTDVWYEFFNHTSIKKKIDNYAFIRCDLHIKIVVNASPFYYGALLCSYIPLEDLYNSAKVGLGGEKLVPYSQRPNIVVYPQSCEGGEMVCPFIYPMEWLKLTSATDLRAMGAIDFDSYVPLTSANGNTGTSVDVQVYAWAENVELAGLTVDLAVQSGDEYGKGIVSKPASAIARSTGLLSSLPVIGPFMTATSIAAGAVSNIASLFGYTKVPVIEDVKPYKNLPFHGLAVSDISDCTEKLCIDSKNELTINNMCIGDSSSDPLILSDFVQRPSYLTNFTWTAADPAGSLLWNSYVTPYMSNLTTGTGQIVVQGTPPWLVANLFSFWRGDMIFDLKIICTQYHKGRLRVSWDPVGNIASTTDTSTEVYTSIIDISETTTVSLRVPYCQRTAYQKIPSDIRSVIYDITPLAQDTSDTVNGILTIRVLNEQTSPIDSADITVLVSVRGAENLEFAAPSPINSDLYYYGVQSGIEDLKEVTFGGHSTVDNNINLVYMGEKVTSLRSLLMRCNQTLVELESISVNDTEYQFSVMCRRPLYKGYDPNGIHTAGELVGGANAPYNFVNNTPYHLISQCFLGERGSFTWKVDYDSTEYLTFLIARPKTILTVANYGYSSTLLTGFSASSVAHNFSTRDDTNTGALLLNQKTNTGVSFNAPQYSIVSFYPTSPATRTLGLTNINTDDAIRYSHVAHESYRVETESSYHRYLFQVGSDYSPVFFLNVPTMYIYNFSPAPV